jgi:heme exporter protein D
MGAMAAVAVSVVALVTLVVLSCGAVIERERQLLDRAARRVAAAAARARSTAA